MGSYLRFFSLLNEERCGADLGSVPGCSGRLRVWAPLGPDPVSYLPNLMAQLQETRGEASPCLVISPPPDPDCPTCSRRLCESHAEISSQEGETLFLHIRV